MSLFDLTNTDTPHLPAIKMRERVNTRYGGYERWSCGCICGWSGEVPGWIIPARVSAERLYDQHLRVMGVAIEPEPDEQENSECGMSTYEPSPWTMTTKTSSPNPTAVVAASSARTWTRSAGSSTQAG